MKLTQELQLALSAALYEAAHRGHEYATLEHLLYALLHDRVTRRVLLRAGASVPALKQRLEGHLGDVQVLPEDERGDPSTTLAFQRVLARAAAQRQGAGREDIGGPDVVVSMFAEPESFAVYFLEEQGVTRLELVSTLAHGDDEFAEGPAEATPSPSEAEVEDDEEVEGSARDPLAAYTVDLTAQARAGRLDPLVGRAVEVQRTLQVLVRRRKNNPIFVGDSGVGKTAIAEGLALAIAEGKVPAPLAEASIYSLDLGALVAGTRYRGDFEKRLKGVLKALEARPGAILFIDEIHTLIGAGAAGSGTMDGSNLLKPALRSGQLRTIGATTWEEYRQVFERDKALARRFQKIEVGEPSVEDTVRILEGLRSRYEEHHQVAYSRAALVAAAELSARYLRDRALPDKAIDVVDEAGAAARLEGLTKVGVRQIEAVLSIMAQVPVHRVKNDDREKLRTLEAEIRAKVFGQDAAITTLVSAIKVSRAGLGSVERPVGSFLLTGPTGVGKTEVAKRLAECLGVPLLRFDMSEYMERHTVSRLVGAPPGYVGFDRGGLLTEAVAKSPHAVLLLDEIEKAHPDVFNLLLQVMDHGTLTDTNGKKCDFRQTILLMTSNVGARELAARRPGFGAELGGQATAGREDEGAVEKLFSPEFRNRLDARIAFRPLSPEIMGSIVDKFLGELAESLRRKRVTLEWTPEARALLAEKGHDPAFGARPLGRVVDQTIKRPLTDELLFGRLAQGGRVVVAAEGGEVVLKVVPSVARVQ
ncbi:MAG: ATP-dependent Clp protease ATP-binding subunit ClpA [Thermoanaerobaculia bacterium]|nr:ATP-dependent Clp protease ATP-binding subunit ClpA [Thermoanaerobaculia bacterium]